MVLETNPSIKQQQVLYVCSEVASFLFPSIVATECELRLFSSCVSMLTLLVVVRMDTEGKVWN